MPKFNGKPRNPKPLIFSWLRLCIQLKDLEDFPVVSRRLFPAGSDCIQQTGFLPCSDVAKPSPQSRW